MIDPPQITHYQGSHFSHYLGCPPGCRGLEICILNAININQCYKYISNAIFVTARKRGGWPQNWRGSGSLESQTLYRTVKSRTIASNITYLLSHIKPAGSLIHRSRYTLSRNRGLTKQVASKISMNMNLCGLKFPPHITYIYSTRFLYLQVNRACIPNPVKSSPGTIILERPNLHAAVIVGTAFWGRQSWTRFAPGP